MLTTLLGAAVLVAGSLLGPLVRQAAGPGVCDACGIQNAVILEQITRLQTGPNQRVRDHAAHALRKFDWRCHPEVVEVLAFALLNDPDGEVREESAQALTKLAPSMPVAHLALRQAANSDPDRSTRRWARKGLKALSGHCEGPCPLCNPEIVIAPPPPGHQAPSGGPTFELPIPATPSEPALPPIDSSVVPRVEAPAIEPQTAPPLEGPAPDPGRVDR